MITVAIAGGTSPGLGRAIVNALRQYSDEVKTVVLSRQSSKNPEWLQQMNVNVCKVDYASENSLFEALQGVHTVISVLLATDGTWASAQKTLLNAGLRAGISRFAPAEFGLGPLAADWVDMLRPSSEIRAACEQAMKSHSGFEYARFHVGLFMNYLGYGANNEEEATHGMRDTWIFVWDVKRRKASIPLTKEGKVPQISLTEIGDVGRFVASACLLPEGTWQEDFSLAGDTMSLTEVIEIIERVRGGKFEVEYRPYDLVVKEETEADMFYPDKFWLQIEQVIAKDKVGAGIMEPIVNRLCPLVKPASVEQYLERFWSD